MDFIYLFNFILQLTDFFQFQKLIELRNIGIYYCKHS